jgi:hypothetical protein
MKNGGSFHSYVTYVSEGMSDVFRNMSDFWRRISDCFRNLFQKSWRPWITFENPGQLCFRNIAGWIESLNSTLHCITLRIMYVYMYIEFYVRYYLHCIYFTLIYIAYSYDIYIALILHFSYMYIAFTLHSYYHMYIGFI